MPTQLITENFLELLPAYGRDYASAKDAKQAFLAGQDFKFASPFPPYAGRYCSFRDFSPKTQVILRFKRLTATTPVRV